MASHHESIRLPQQVRLLQAHLLRVRSDVSRWRPGLAVACAGLVAGATGVAVAHHSRFDGGSDIVAISGTIESIDWRNPHVRIALQVVSETAEAEAEASVSTWLVTGAAAHALERRGLGRGRFEVGASLTVRGVVTGLDPPTLTGAVAELPGGQAAVIAPALAQRLGLVDAAADVLFAPPAYGSAGAVVPTGIFRVWTPRSGSARSAVPAESLREAARNAAARFDPGRDDPALACEPPGMPAMLATPFPVEFVEAGDSILVRYEHWNAERVVHMRPGAGPAVQPHSPRGTSFGRWEGSTLAVFTTYIDYPYVDAAGTPQSRDVTVLERYTPSADFARLDWQAIVTDPSTLREPLKLNGYYAYEPGETIRSFECLPGPE